MFNLRASSPSQVLPLKPSAPPCPAPARSCRSGLANVLLPECTSRSPLMGKKYNNFFLTLMKFRGCECNGVRWMAEERKLPEVLLLTFTLWRWAASPFSLTACKLPTCPAGHLGESARLLATPITPCMGPVSFLWFPTLAAQYHRSVGSCVQQYMVNNSSRAGRRDAAVLLAIFYEKYLTELLNSFTHFARHFTDVSVY